MGSVSQGGPGAQDLHQPVRGPIAGNREGFLTKGFKVVGKAAKGPETYLCGVFTTVSF